MSIQQQLLKSLKKIDRPGTFCMSGQLPPTYPGLEVTGLGPIALPLETRRAAEIKKQARQAPYGKGTETLVDTNVRRVWEIDADQVMLTNPDWRMIIDQALESVQSELGLEKQKLDAHLYKLLLYKRGSFFQAHRDGEKLDRMVATLVIALPSAHTGGELVVRHEGQERIVNFGLESRFQTQFAAFYADCEHEILPVTSGFRLALVYNLTLAKSKQAITAPSSTEQITAVSGILKKWKEKPGKAQAVRNSRWDRPMSKLAVLLDHEYTPTGLSFDALKGIDRAKANVLFAAAQQVGCDAFLSLVTKWVAGSAEPTGDFGYSYSRYEDEDGDSEHVMGEIIDEEMCIKDFSDIDGNRLAFGRLPISDEEIISETSLDDNEPDEEDFEGYTGNAGMTLERWYYRAAIVLWPSESRFDVLCEAGVKSAVGGLAQMIRQWQQDQNSEQAAIKQTCLDFASRIITYWPERSDPNRISNQRDYLVFDEDNTSSSSAGSENVTQPLLSLLAELDESTLIAAWFHNVLARDAAVEPGTLLGDICKEHGWLTFQDELLALFERTSNETLERHARLLADWSLRKDKNSDRIKVCSQLAEQIMTTVELWNPKPKKRDWHARTVDLPALLPLLMQTFIVLKKPKLLGRLVDYVFDQKKEIDLTLVQIPVLLRLKSWLEKQVKQSSPALRRWLTAIHTDLKSRAADSPQPPVDWARSSTTHCDCADCQKLIEFLDDPLLETVRFPLAKQRRQHLHQVIDQHKLDTTHVTEHRGSPHKLVCTKTQKSYERALKAYRLDLDHLEKISELQEWEMNLPSKSSDRPVKKSPKKSSRK